MVQYPPKSKKCVPKNSLQTTRRKRCTKGKQREKIPPYDCVKNKNMLDTLSSSISATPLTGPLVKSTIIGQGAYGCVYRPSIPCAVSSKNISEKESKNLISKFMYTKDAKKEMEEFKLIHRKDPSNQFHLGIPTICQPDFADPAIVKELKQCVIKDPEPMYDESQNAREYSVLTFPYGGLNLKDFCKKRLEHFSAAKTKIFWKKGVLNLLNGLIFFRNNDMIHYDLKPHNILFNEDKMQMRYIDFGMMMSRSEFIASSANNTNNNGSIHWSYPFENGFVNADVLRLYTILSPAQKDNFKTQIRKLIVDGIEKRHPIDIGLSISHPDNVSHVFDFTIPPSAAGDKTKFERYADDNIDLFFQGLDELIAQAIPSDFKQMQFGRKVNMTFIKMTADAIDVYGLGFTLQYVANSFYKKGKISREFYTKCSALFETMYTFNPLTRELNVDLLRKQYEEILRTTKI
jgi:serine/threonine protein kinase